MSIADELSKLQDLYRKGTLNEEEFAAAKRAVLSGTTPVSTGGGDSATNAHLEELRFQNEVARLDREWALEREDFMVTGKYGGRYLPSAGMSLIGGVVVVGFGIFWTSMAASAVPQGAPVFMPMFGVVFILLGVGMSIYSFMKATGYQFAQRKYRARRARLFAERNGPPLGKPQ